MLLEQLPPIFRAKLPDHIRAILEAAPSVQMPRDTGELVDWAVDGQKEGWYEVAYDLPEQGRVVEARVCRVRNGLLANYPEPYMRRRDPGCMVIADDLPSNKRHYRERFQSEFGPVRQQTFDWLSGQRLCVLPFVAGGAGGAGGGIEALAIAPANAGFFAFGLALLQGMLPPEAIGPEFNPKAVIYVAPPFRHTHFEGKQIVVHDRGDDLHEMFAFNLYPGPSAKKGVYGMLIHQGEDEGWLTAHCSTVQVVTPYDNVVTIMHEGASGGGKSEMLEHIHRELDGRLLIGKNTLTGEKRHLALPRGCELWPVTDDMALCHPSLQTEQGKLTVMDAENAWFMRVNHITEYGTDAHLEKLTVAPPEPLLFLSLDAVPGSRALIWEHVEDSPGVPCPNPRVVIPRRAVPGVVDEAVTVDIRSFGVRMPPCTRENPTYGIVGIFHILPPALAWLWRLVAPRGHDNPSIVSTEGMSSEGVGSYWPFATGRRVDQANLLLQQIQQTTRTRFIICPNQHIGAWKVGFAPQWIAREYLARRGNARFRRDSVEPARCPLLGHVPNGIQVEGSMLPPIFLRVWSQEEVGPEGYDRGAQQLVGFFHTQLEKFLEPDLLPLGRQIIQCCLDGGAVTDYDALIPHDTIA